MKSSEAYKITSDNSLGMVCDTCDKIYGIIKEQAKSGLTNTFVVVLEKNLYNFKKELKENGYSVYSREIKRDEPQGLDYFNKCAEDENIYELEIEWHRG
jgi:hypothetical protein